MNYKLYSAEIGLETCADNPHKLKLAFNYSKKDHAQFGGDNICEPAGRLVPVESP